MLLVQTSCHSEQQQLQQAFSTDSDLYQVPRRQSSQVSALLIAATYERFHSAAPGAVIKMQQFALRCLDGVISLDLYREALSALWECQERCQTYHQYLIKMNQAFEEAPLLTPLSPEPQNLDELLEVASRCHEKSTSILEMAEVPLLRLGFREDCELDAQSDQTQITKSSKSRSKKETLSGALRLANFFHSPSAVYSREEWQTKREKNHSSSRQIDSFKKRSCGVIELNGNLGELLAGELAYDIQRQALQSAPLGKELKDRQARYNRSIKDALVFSKIGLRKRK